MSIIEIQPSMEQLAEQVVGAVFVPGQDGFEDAAACFNASVVHRPDVVVEAASAEDVQAAVRWASANDLRVSVQATGHGAVRPIEGGVLISTANMQDLHIDPHSRLAVIDAGVKWKRVADEAAPFELAPLCGSSSDVGAIGYTLGGGLAVLGRTFGFASDWVVAFEVVTADGDILRVTAEDGSELFWALRGGKSNAAIVTSMTVELLPVGEFYGGAIYYDGSDAEKILRAYAEWTKDLPDAMTTALSLKRLPPMPDVPEPLRARFTMHLSVAYVGDEAAGAELLQPMRDIAPAIIDGVRMLPTTESDQVHHDPEHPVPMAYAGMVIDELSQDVIDALIANAGPDTQCPLLMIELRHLGGAMLRRVSDDAVGLRTDGFAVMFLGALMPPIAEYIPGAIDGLKAALQPFSTGGSFVNLHGPVSSQDDRRRPWSAKVANRLEAVKQHLDPEHRFAFGHWA